MKYNEEDYNNHNNSPDSKTNYKGNKHKKKINIDEETETLLKHKTNQLKNKFQKLKEDIDSLQNENKTIYDKEYINPSNGKSDKSKINNNDSKIGETNKINSCSIYTFGFIYFIFYLVGIFQLLDLFDATKKQMNLVFKSCFFNKTIENDENFSELFVNSCFKNIPEFDFAFISSIIGSLPLNCLGFFLTSLIFTITNIVLIFTYTELNFVKKKNYFSDFLYTFIYLILFYIFFGTICLFSHEKIFEGLLYFEKTKKKFTENEIQNTSNIKKEKKRSNEKYFKILCFGIIMAYLINKGINIILYKYVKNKYVYYLWL